MSGHVRTSQGPQKHLRPQRVKLNMQTNHLIEEYCFKPGLMKLMAYSTNFILYRRVLKQTVRQKRANAVSSCALKLTSKKCGEIIK